MIKNFYKMINSFDVGNALQQLQEPPLVDPPQSKTPVHMNESLA